MGKAVTVTIPFKNGTSATLEMNVDLGPKPLPRPGGRSFHQEYIWIITKAPANI